MTMYKEIPLLTPADVELRVAQIQQTKYGNYVTLARGTLNLCNCP